jgi:hypothetical protein
MLAIAAIGLNQALSTNALNVSLAAANGERPTADTIACRMQKSSWHRVHEKELLSETGHFEGTSCFTEKHA